MTTPKFDYTSLLKIAFEAPTTKERPLGCGRIYVAVDKVHARGISAAAKKLGRLFQSKGHNGMSNVLYVGYDNCDGGALARGTKIVEIFKASGVGCYREEQGD